MLKNFHRSPRFSIDLFKRCSLGVVDGLGRGVSDGRGDETRAATPCLVMSKLDIKLNVLNFVFRSLNVLFRASLNMAIPRRLILLLTATFLLLLVAMLLATAIEIRAPPPKMMAVTLAQAAKYGESEREIAAKALLNGTGFDRGDILNGTTIAPAVYTSTMTRSDEGMIGDQETPAPTPSADEGYIEPEPTSRPAARPTPQPDTQIPILALSYSSSGGPKHCRGSLLQKMSFARPAAQWKNGSCINLPNDARCGVFYSEKGDNCEAQLFNEADCYNTTMTYVNTVVFMPEERPVGALWRSMFVKCGVDVPEAKMLDPAVLGGALGPKKPPVG